MKRLIGLMMLLATGCLAEQGFWKFYRPVPAPEGVSAPGMSTFTRVNDPQIAFHNYFGGRGESRQSGMLAIRMQDDLRQMDRATLFIEIWGGHPKTCNKRVSINGRNTYYLPEVGTAAGRNTHQYPELEIDLSDLVGDWNALQFNGDRGHSFWGHYIVSPELRVRLKPSHPDLDPAWTNAVPSIVVDPAGASESLQLRLDLPEAFKGRVARVEYFGRYVGYDENGNNTGKDWHGITKKFETLAHLGTAREGNFGLVWDLSMLPNQVGMAVKAKIFMTDPDNLYYETETVENLRTPERPQDEVRLLSICDYDDSMWVRANGKQTRSFMLPIDPDRVARAQLHIVIWDGGRGEVEHPFELNGEPLDGIAEDGDHTTFYKIVEIDPKRLKRGENTISVTSDTEHHGIEVLRPGPALMIRCRTD